MKTRFRPLRKIASLFLAGALLCAAVLPARAQGFRLRTEFPDVDGDVLCMALDPDRGVLYIGGSFRRVGSEARRDAAAIDAASGRVLPWNPDCGGIVACLAVSGDRVYLGGYFETVGGQPRSNLAAVDAATGSVLAWNPSANDAVQALAVSGSTIYAGGFFNAIGSGNASTPRAYLAAITADGALLPFNPIPDDRVYALALGGSTLYAAGAFGSIGGAARKGVAAVDLSSGTVLPWHPASNDYGLALVLRGNTLYVGGYQLVGAFDRAAALSVFPPRRSPRRAAPPPSPLADRISTSAVISKSSTEIRASASPPSMRQRERFSRGIPA